MKIKICGTIVSPDYDDEYFAAWIDRGIITPSSRVVAAIESAAEPVDVYINSYGGDVFAGGEMQIALVKAAVEGKIRKCEVGSIAASMAANIVAALRANGSDVEGHANSQLMFHGCYTTTEGGAQHHEDVAESLRNINEGVMANLKRCGVEECRAWFAEGREKWLPADECKRLSLFTSIAETDAEAPAEAKQTAARLAAFASSVMSRKEYKSMIDETIQAEEQKPETVETPAAETAPEAAPAVAEPTPEVPAGPVADEPVKADEAPAETVAPTAEDIEAKVADLANKRFAGLQAKHDQMISELKEKLANAVAALAAANAERDQAVEASAKAKAALDEAVNQAKLAEQNRESVVTAALAPAPKTRAERKAEVEKNWQALMHERTAARRNK